MTPSAVAEKRAFLKAYDRTGTLEQATEATGTPLESHQAWMKDRDYSTAYHAITRDLKRPKRPEKPARVAHARPNKRKRQHKEAQPAQRPADDNPAPRPPTEPQPAQRPVDRPEPPSVTIAGNRGYTKLYVREGEPLPAAEEPAPAPKPPAEPDWVATSEVTVASDADQRRIIDEYGELDRRMQLRAMDTQRYESLKKAIKCWFDRAPADADGTVEGDVYLLHLSARERERKVRDMHGLVDLLGLEKVLELATIPLGPLENLLGKAHVARLTTDTRSGSRRIKAIPLRGVGVRSAAENNANRIAPDQGNPASMRPPPIESKE